MAKTHRTREQLLDLFEKWRPMGIWLADQYARFGDLPFEDLRQIAWLTIWENLPKLDPGMNHSQATAYLAISIRHRLRKESLEGRSVIRIPERVWLEWWKRGLTEGGAEWAGGFDLIQELNGDFGTTEGL